MNLLSLKFNGFVMELMLVYYFLNSALHSGMSYVSGQTIQNCPCPKLLYSRLCVGGPFFATFVDKGLPHKYFLQEERIFV